MIVYLWLASYSPHASFCVTNDAKELVLVWFFPS